jgi:Uma2 family endonuclease
LDLANEPQPDAVLILDHAAGGGARLTTDGYLEGVPEIVVEIAASSVSIDMGSKQQADRRNGVQEYLVWQSYENRIEWFALQDGVYVTLLPDEVGIIQSQVFPGLWLAVEALLAGDMVRVLEVVQQGIRSSEHQAFIQRLG